MVQLPENYTIGQEYCKELIDATIDYFIYSNVLLGKELNFEIKQGKVKIFNKHNRLVIQYTRKISRLLIDNLINKNIGFNFLAGYLKGILPNINTEINTYKYKTGHILNRPISIFDIIKCEILEIDTNVKNSFQFNLIFPEFPKLVEVKSDNDKFFVHEFIDAVTSYLYNNLDDSIRKLITSLEDSFREFNIPNDRDGKTLYFRDRLNIFLEKDNYPQWKQEHLRILKNNMNFIYTLRNKIVHENLRLDYSESWFEIVYKGIITLRYIYTSGVIEGEITDYIYYIEVMIKLIDSSVINLDSIESNNKSKHVVIRNGKNMKSDLDNFVFKGIEIPERLKRMVLH